MAIPVLQIQSSMQSAFPNHSAMSSRCKLKIAAELSDIALFHILPRLPAMSVLRCKCVCKEWHSFLTTSTFFKMRLDHLITNKMVFLSATTPNEFRTIDCERPEEGLSAARPLPFKVGPGQVVRILTSAHGMVCIGIISKARHGRKARRGRHGGMDKYYSDLILWNPTTGDHKTLSKPLVSTHQDCYLTNESLFGLYHSSWDNDYKLLRVTFHPKVYIYSLKSDSWRKVESDLQRTREYNFLQNFWVPSVPFNENLYFLEYIPVENSHSIMKFNTKTETLKLIATPSFGNQKTTWLSFTVLRDGYIHLWVNIENSLDLSSENELWRMDGDGDWTKVVNSGTIMSNPCFERHRRLHLMRNGNLLMYREGCAYQVDLKTHNKHLCSNTTGKMLVWQGGKYIETMVSPNRYSK